MVRTDVPKPTASVNADPEALHQAIDGRVWFFPEAPNGWSTAGSADPVNWYAIDFGRPLRLGSAELSFFADGAGVAAPSAYRVQVWRDGAWADVSPQTSSGTQPIAGGVNRLSWRPVISSRLRAVFTSRPGAALRLVELKVF